MIHLRRVPKTSAFVLLALVMYGHGSASDEFERAPIRYSQAIPGGRIAELEKRIASGEKRFEERDDRSFLRELLRELEIPVASQLLVFSKTSEQIWRVTPRTPRAIYYSDDCYVGWVQHGLIEIASIDDRLGPVFYVVHHRDAQQPVRFERSESCLSCHAGSNTRNFPGVLVRSVYTDEGGFPIFSEGSFVTDHRSPLRERWGGWYVTGKHGDQRHMGNVFAKRVKKRVRLNRRQGANRTSLAGLVATDAYLTRTSDIVALMVLEHQTSVQNTLTRAGMTTRAAIYRQGEIQRELGEPITEELTGSALSIVKSQTEKVIRQLLFCGETELEDRVEGGQAFQDALRKKGRHTSDGRSLRDLDLETRLFRYRLSYMIHSRTFDALPGEIKSRIYARLWGILNSEDRHPRFAHLEDDEKREIIEILRETKTDLPESWKRVEGQTREL